MMKTWWMMDTEFDEPSSAAPLCGFSWPFLSAGICCSDSGGVVELSAVHARRKWCQRPVLGVF